MVLLSASISISQLLAANPPISTDGNVNIINTGDNNSEPIALCYLPYLFPFTTGDGTPSNDKGQYEGLAAIFLAMEHLNTGNGELVPELNGINQRCPLRFTTKAFDTEMQQSVGVNHIITLTDRSRTQELLPSAILGAASSKVSIPTSIISGLRGFPQVSPSSTSAALDDKSQYKLFGRTIPNDDGTAIPLVEKLTSWNVRYIAVLHVDDAYGNAFAKGIRLAAQRDTPDLRVETMEITIGADDDKISDAIQQLKQTDFTFFFGIVWSKEFVDRIMTEAYNQGIAGTGRHTWLFSDAMGSSVIGRGFPIGSKLEKAYRGTGVLSAVGGIRGINVVYDKLTRSMQQLGGNEEDRSYLDSHFPRDYPDGKVVNHSIITDQEAFLKVPGLVAPFVYDSIVALGIASCGLLEISDNTDYFTGEELFQALLNTTFDGASGSIILDPDTGTRDPRSALFSLTNFIDDDDASIDQGMVQFKRIETDLFKSGEWEPLVPYTFNNGASDIPLDLPILNTNSNYLSAGLKAIGLILCGIIIALALSFGYWTYRNSGRQVVRSSQPIFLYIISAGTLLMGLSIIPLTIDLGVTDQKGADAACMAFPWLLAVGFSLTFSALFTKTRRINQIMRSTARFERVKVTAVDVIKPMVTLLMLNAAVLTIWTVIDPLQRQTVVVTQDPFLRNVETYGVCDSDHVSTFLAILCVINLGSLIFALFQAYMARKISTELQESSYIFLAMSIILLVSFIGIPVIIIARDNSAALYFVTAGLIFVVCSSLLLLIFIPKVWALTKKSSNTNTSASSRFSSATSTREGIKILSTPVAQAELGEKNRGLMVEQAELEKENRELKRLLSAGKSREGNENQISSITFLDVENRNSSDSAAENDHARGSVQFSADVKEIPSKADIEV
mmetsp:Transcript_28701/g.53060  ORF Transcript_28701/g.53060 Transcript_28701/m.53060 type:complete len:899 (-) Transcript_28701:897-3593(-)